MGGRGASCVPAREAGRAGAPDWDRRDGVAGEAEREMGETDVEARPFPAALEDDGCVDRVGDAAVVRIDGRTRGAMGLAGGSVNCDETSTRVLGSEILDIAKTREGGRPHPVERGHPHRLG